MYVTHTDTHANTDGLISCQRLKARETPPTQKCTTPQTHTHTNADGFISC